MKSESELLRNSSIACGTLIVVIVEMAGETTEGVDAVEVLDHEDWSGRRQQSG